MRWRSALSQLVALLALACPVGCGAPATELPRAPMPPLVSAGSTWARERMERIAQNGLVGPSGIDDPNPYRLAGTVEALASLAAAKRRNHMPDEELTRALVLGVVSFAHVYDRDGSSTLGAKPDGPWRRAEAALTKWLTENAAAVLEGPDGSTVATALFRAARGRGSLAYAKRWPGFDVQAAGARVAAQWVASGYVDTPISVVVLCNERGARGARSGDPEDTCAWAPQSLGDVASQSRFAKLLLDRADPALTRAVFASLRAASASSILELWHALRPQPVVWHAASEALVDSLAGANGLDEAAARLWSEPAERPVALYLLAHRGALMARRSASSDDWERFARAHGAPVSETTFGAMLDLSPLAVSVATPLWDQLRPGFVRLGPVLRHLDAYLDDRDVSPAQCGTVMETIHQRVCDDHSQAENAAWTRFVAGRKASHPNDPLDWDGLRSMSAGCKHAKR